MQSIQVAFLKIGLLVPSAETFVSLIVHVGRKTLVKAMLRIASSVPSISFQGKVVPCPVLPRDSSVPQRERTDRRSSS